MLAYMFVFIGMKVKLLKNNPSNTVFVSHFFSLKNKIIVDVKKCKRESKNVTNPNLDTYLE